MIQNYREQAAQVNNQVNPLADIPVSLRPKPFKNEVYNEGLFTADWFSHNIPQLYHSLEKADRTFNDYLEIGSFEGLSTCWMARLLELKSQKPSITAIDFFGYKPDHGDFGKHFDKNVGNFIKNIAVKKIKSHSAKALADLFQEKSEFDLIYVDGAHDALNVIVDASLCWRMLRDGGVIIFDDYFWFSGENSKNVLHAVNAFLNLIEGQFKVLGVYHQVVLKKLSTELPVNIF
ncbi:MAG TPA: class I SAM-dependent methyltransferase [Bacteroidales bacterium]|nr:class I SAM-dependent methyltransferase [Bacteroidales bacterium]